MSVKMDSNMPSSSAVMESNQTLPFGAHPAGSQHALRLVQPPIKARWAARLLLFMFAATGVALIFVPWQQSLSATGKVTAFKPTLREQIIEAPITGRIIKIHVVEGQQVKGRVLDDDGKPIAGREGTLLVSIRDPDPALMERLQQQKVALQQKQSAARKRKESLEQQVKALQKSKEKALGVAKRRIQMAEKRVVAAKEAAATRVAALKLADFQQKQEKQLLDEGLTSQLNYQQATQRQISAQAEKNRADSLVLEASLSVLAFESESDKVSHDFDASIRSVVASREKAVAEIASVDTELASLNVRIARQGTQDVYAPCDGVVFRIMARSSSGGTLVQSGTPLVRIVPDIPDEERVVELFLDGNDAVLVTELWRETVRKTGEKPIIPVRIQFEGYPAVQWVGWPSAAVGTFGGIIDFVDQTDDGKGRFRILVRRDPEEEKTNPWPEGFALRQGVRANGWVLLNRVTLGWELWRRLNGFPPVVAEDRTGGKKTKPAAIKGIKPK